MRFLGGGVGHGLLRGIVKIIDTLRVYGLAREPSEPPSDSEEDMVADEDPEDKDVEGDLGGAYEGALAEEGIEGAEGEEEGEEEEEEEEGDDGDDEDDDDDDDDDDEDEDDETGPALDPWFGSTYAEL